MYNKNYKHLTNINIAFVVILLVSNIISTKIVDLKFFVFDAGTLLFPLSYIFADVLTEVYGYKNSKKVIWSGFFSILFMALVIIIVTKLPQASDWPYQKDFENILWLAPRIVVASLFAYLLWEFSNSYIMAKLKIYFKWKKLWIRTISSTLVGELFDTIIFTLIAFYGVWSNNLLITIIISNYIFKVWIEVIFTPFTYKIVNFLKKQENEDYYDYKTNFNPLNLK